MLSVAFSIVYFFLTLHLIIIKSSTSELLLSSTLVNEVLILPLCWWIFYLQIFLHNIIFYENLLQPGENPTTTILLAHHQWMFGAWSGQSRMRPGLWPLSMQRDWKQKVYVEIKEYTCLNTNKGSGICDGLLLSMSCIGCKKFNSGFGFGKSSTSKADSGRQHPQLAIQHILVGRLERQQALRTCVGGRLVMSKILRGSVLLLDTRWNVDLRGMFWSSASCRLVG